MSKINKIRITNLNYNNNNFKINDEVFYLNSESTLFNLRNGGGKSVLVQMMTAPFVRAKYRKTVDRPFESYFKGMTPSYILVEWKLEHEAGYLLTGMMVRKKEVASDDDSKEKLDIINFIHEYKEENKFDLESLKIIEEDEKIKKVKSFGNTKKLFEDLKKNKDIKFNYYDMANSKTSRDYFNKLLEYGIDHKEWESIIKQINVKESGLSELFNKAKDTKGLVNTWFIPNIEKKLDKDDSRIKNYRTLIESYVKQYKKNEADIEKKEKMELFKTISENLFDIAKDGTLNLEEKENIENLIINTLNKLQEEIKGKEDREEGIEDEKNSFLEKIEELQYEELSIKIHKKKDEKLKLEAILEELVKNIDKTKYEKDETSRKKAIIECAKIYVDYTKYSQNLQLIEDKLKILRDKSKGSKEEVDNLRYTLKLITEKELEETKRGLSERVSKEEEKESERKGIEEELDKERDFIGTLKGRKGEYKGRVDDFDSKEKKFNRNFKAEINRNIEGLINEKVLLELDEEIRNNVIEIDRKKKSFREEILILQGEEKNRTSEREKVKENITRNDIALKEEKKILTTLEEELEERYEILKYIDFSDKRIFERDEIIKEFDRKLEEFRNSIKASENEETKLEKEVSKLKTGSIVDIPKEVLNILKEKDIKVIYGLEWLKKNGNTEEDNIKIVEKNPFIPYSLIMEKREIEILREERLEFFTSNPISIIDREELRLGLDSSVNKIIDIDKVKFLIAFNNKLLNEKELKDIINSKESLIENLNKVMAKKKESINLYDGKLTKVKTSKLTLEIYEKTKNNIKNLEKEERELKENNLYLEKETGRLGYEIQDKEKEIKSLDIEKSFNEKKKEAFNEFKEDYKIYTINKENLEETLEKIKLTDNSIKEKEEKFKKINEDLKELAKDINTYSYLKEEKEAEYSKYESYKSGEKIEKDKEDLVARLRALTEEIRNSEEELLKEKARESENFRLKEEEIIACANEYKIEEKVYKNETYNRIKELDIKKKEKEVLEKEKALSKEYSKIDKDLAVKDSEIKSLKNNLQEKCNKEEEKPKETLIEKNFKEETEKLKIEIKRLEKERKDVRKEKENLNTAASSLSEFDNLKIKEKLEVLVNVKTIESETAKLKRDLNNVKDRITKNSMKIKDEMIKIEISKDFKDELFFKDTIQILKSLNEKPKGFKEQLDKILETYDRMIKKLKVDIDIIEKEEEQIIINLLEYIEEVHVNIGKIDENSTIEIKGRKLKMLNINILNFEESKEGYRLRLKNYVEGIRDRALITLKKNENIEDIISSNITTLKLYDEVVGVSTIDIKLYKIEEDKQRKISWKEVSQNSGGEGFLSAFVILSSLLSYMRRDESNIFTKKEEGKVLVMDNPFAQTNAAHLLKPLMDIAKKSNTQLICLTGLNGESIYNRFDNIYVLNLVSSRIKEGVKNLKSEHIKGEEESNLVASRFKIEEDQIKLF
ncbi:MAG: hypothetical protein ACRC30_09560 [Clostridium sp.]